MSLRQFALDLPKFMQGTSKEKAEILLQVIGVGEQLYEIENREKQLYNERTAIGRIADQKKKFAEEIVDLSRSTERTDFNFRAYLKATGDTREERLKTNASVKKHNHIFKAFRRTKSTDYKSSTQLDVVLSDLEIAQKSALDLHDESTEELEQNIKNIEQINIKVRANMDKDKAEEEAKEYKDKYDELTTSISNVRKEKTDLIEECKSAA